ncbi:MAG: M28 family peptidase, partial [candidate division KSB1 bacterium]|nr:M28 family peptidase [candidate division KSB1 bacterium]
MKRNKAMTFVMLVVLAIFYIVDDLIRPTGEANAAGGGNPQAITAAQLQAYLSFIASDELEGRDTPSRGLNIAAKFIATHLARWGLAPVGDNGTYFQHIALQRLTIDPAQTIAEIDGQRFRFGEDFLAQPNSGTLSGPLVYVGHGWVIKSKNIDPYQGIVVKNKIMVHLAGLPEGISFRELTGRRGEDWESPSGYAQKNGAIGLIVIPNFNTLSRWQRNLQNVVGRGMIRVEKFQEAESERLPEITVSPRMAEVLFEGEEEEANVIFKRSVAGEPVAPFDFSPKKSVRFTVVASSEPEMTQNVVAVLEGSDRKLKNEYVAIGAHYDHVGIGRAVAGDSIYNGADDDGSGTVATLAIAEAFAAGPRPKRSLLFVWHAGEERGLWGSK